MKPDTVEIVQRGGRNARSRWMPLHCCVRLLLALLAASGAQAQVHDQVARDLLMKMTTEEKIELMSAAGFATRPLARLGLPALQMTDGPMGVRWDTATAFPAAIAMAATWDVDLVTRVGWAIGREVRAKGRHMLLGPRVNISRVPHGGRNFESFGEDPHLAARMAVAYIKGVQENKVVACVGHFACGNQEWERESIDVQVDERTLREVYLPAFEAAVREGGVWSVTAAGNKVNGVWCSENAFLLDRILRKEWGFRGMVVSDLGASHGALGSATAGLDLEMPTEAHYGKELLESVRRGEVSEQVINDRVERLLRVMSWAGLFTPQVPPDPRLVGCDEHREIARQVAEEGMILLRNRGNLLPIEAQKIHTLAVIGPNAAVPRTGGGGRSRVIPRAPVSPLEGLMRRAGKRVAVRFARGCAAGGDVAPIPSAAFRCLVKGVERPGLLGEYYGSINLSGTPRVVRVDSTLDFDWGDGAPAPGIAPDSFSVRWSGYLIPPETGEYQLSALGDDGFRLMLEGRVLIDMWGDHDPLLRNVRRTLERGKKYALSVEYYENRGGSTAKLGWDRSDSLLLIEATRTARDADVAVVVLGLSDRVEREGADREDIDLPLQQRRLIRAITGVNPNTVVVLVAGSPVVLGDEFDHIPALLNVWYPGEEGGNAIAGVLFGDVNPSGKLPVTFPRRWEDCPAFSTYPGKNGATQYREGVFVGYRHFDSRRIEPEFPFGFGLSYTTFEYDSLVVSSPAMRIGSSTTASLFVRNTGTRAGAEVVQFYLRDVRSTVPRPEKELKDFRRVFLQPGESRRVEIRIGVDALAFFDPERRSWAVEPGTFELLAGSSSRDIRGRAAFVVE